MTSTVDAEYGAVPATEIFGRTAAPVPWPATTATLAAAIKLLPTLDDVAAGLVEDLAGAIIDRDDELRGVRAVMSPALTLLHEQHNEILRLKRRLAELLDERRLPQRPAA